MIVGLFLWVGFAVAVAVAANARGRNAVGWLILAVLISPLIAGLIVLALPSLAVTAANAAAQPFVPQGVLVGIPYRTTSKGQIEAMLPGGRTIFKDLEQLTTVANGGSLEYRTDPQLLARYPEEVNGYRYHVRVDGRVAVLTPSGEQTTFSSWKAFWTSANSPHR